jgi:hypothetical protein
MDFQGLGGRRVEADFGGGHVTSDGGVLLLREVDLALNICGRFAQCFSDYRDRRFVEHSVVSLLRQRVMGLCLGYEDLNDHDALRVDPLLAAACGKTDAEGKHRARTRDKGRALAGHSTLDRIELAREAVDYINPTKRYYKIVHHPEQVEALFVTLFLESHAKPPAEIVLDFDPTDIVLHGEQEGRFFHGYYGNYCYLPLYVFCGDHLLVAQLRTSNRDASDGALEVMTRLVTRIRAAWPEVRIVMRGDSAFAREGLMRYCEETPNVYYVFGLAKNKRLKRAVLTQLVQAKTLFEQSGHASRVYTEFRYRTLDTWSRTRRVVAKAEWMDKGPNPRFVVTNLRSYEVRSKELYEVRYCARGDMENRIKEQQLDLFADRTSSQFFRANQLRVWLSAIAYVLMSALRRTALVNTRLAKATCQSIRLKLLKIGARVVISVRRIVVHLASACPARTEFIQAWNAIRHYPLRT